MYLLAQNERLEGSEISSQFSTLE